MKAITLPDATWGTICDALEATDDGQQFAALIREQTSGRMKVRATHGGMNVTLTAPKGGDLRGVIEALAGKKL